MSLLFTIENKVVKPHIETLLVYPFKEIWERDIHPAKMNAMEDFTYIEFMVSVKKSNPYSGYDSSERKERVRQDIITRPEWEEDELIIAGLEYLTQHQRDASMTYNYYMAARKGAEKIQKFFEDLDMTKVNFKTGLPIYKPKEVTSALMDTAKILENLNALKTKVDNEIFEEVKNKGQKQVSVFADPSTL